MIFLMIVGQNPHQEPSLLQPLLRIINQQNTPLTTIKLPLNHHKTSKITPSTTIHQTFQSTHRCQDLPQQVGRAITSAVASAAESVGHTASRGFRGTRDGARKGLVANDGERCSPNGLRMVKFLFNDGE